MVFPPLQHLDIDARAVSGITGSISIACWVVVYSPQILTNFQRGSAEGLSLAFLIAWLSGDVFNVVGAVLQGVIPTMVILAVYYTFADIILLLQCLYYKRRATSTLQKINHPIDASHLSPATPLLSDQDKINLPPARPSSLPSTILFNIFSVITVCAVGVLGWYFTESRSHHEPAADISFSVLGQLFGYLCALLYLGSRVPQILLNYRRKSCDGISLLFFTFASLGNLTFVVSILAYVPHAKGQAGRSEWWRYVFANASWLLGSAGTLALDFVIFGQFFWYRDLEKECEEQGEEGEEGEEYEREGAIEVRLE